MVPDYEEAAYNIEHFLTDGKKVGAIGALITVWNDDGETMYAPGWWSIVYGAACAWEPGLTNVNEFNRKYDWAFYRNTDHRFADALMSLWHLNEIMRAGKPIVSFDLHTAEQVTRFSGRTPSRRPAARKWRKCCPSRR